MAKLVILATDESPQILFDPAKGTLEVSGKSLPEDTIVFYGPLEQAAIEYVENPQPVTTIDFDLVYVNSSSTKRILSIISHFEKLQEMGLTVIFNWHYDEFDENMKDEGEEFGRLSDLKINLIKKQGIRW